MKYLLNFFATKCRKSARIKIFVFTHKAINIFINKYRNCIRLVRRVRGIRNVIIIYIHTFPICIYQVSSTQMLVWLNWGSTQMTSPQKSQGGGDVIQNEISNQVLWDSVPTKVKMKHKKWFSYWKSRIILKYSLYLRVIFSEENQLETQ